MFLRRKPLCCYMITDSITFLSLSCCRVSFHCSINLQRFIREKDTNICWRWTRYRRGGALHREEGEGPWIQIRVVAKSVTLGGSWKWCSYCKWSPIIPVRRCAAMKSTQRHNWVPTGFLHPITIWMNEKCVYCMIRMQALVGINSTLAVCRVQSPTMGLGDVYPYTGVSPHVWLHVSGRYLTKHRSGNLRCWYSCYPLTPPPSLPSFHMHGVFWERAACLKPGGTGVWSEGANTV